MSERERPNPDALMSSLQCEQAASKRGRLKVFLGMCPGVGKTCAKLEAAHHELAASRDVAIGYVETHERQETDALLPGLPRHANPPAEPGTAGHRACFVPPFVKLKARRIPSGSTPQPRFILTR